MTIKVYPSLMPGQPIETHEHAACTLASWLNSKGIDYSVCEAQPITVIRNGHQIDAGQWSHAELMPADQVEIRMIPHGGVFNALGSIIGKIFNVAFGWLMPNAKSASSSSSERGAQLETAQADANRAKLGDVVPEPAGRHLRYPDYLTPPRRLFLNQREQWLEFLCCVGPGRYQISDLDVKVGETPFALLGGDAVYAIYPPGADLTGVSAHEHWYSAPEVGGTSSGTAGLELSTEPGNRENTDPSQYFFSGGSIERTGEFPVAWGVGTQVQVAYPQPYDVTTVLVDGSGGGDDGGTPGYSFSNITGYFGHVPSETGDIVTLGGFDSRTSYRVRSSDSLGDGLKTLSFETLTSSGWEGQGDPVVLPPGMGQIFRFGSDIGRTVTTFTEETLGVSPGGFEVGVVSGAQVRFSGGATYGEWTSEFAITPKNESTGVIEFDVFFPNGLAYIRDSGGLSPQSVGIEFQYRNRDGGPRVTASWFYEQATLDQIGFTERVASSRGRWMGRMRRVGAESTSTQVQDKVQWYGLRSRLDTRTSYPNWTTMSVRLRSGGRLAAQSENKINLIIERMLPTLHADGTWGAPAPTRDISAFARYIASTIGYSDSELDMEAFARLHSVWSARGETLDYIFDLTTVKAALSLSFEAGMAELTVNDGQIKPVRDDVRTQFEQAYSPQNMIGSLKRAFAGPKPDDADGVEVEYVDGESWKSETVRCLLPGDQGFKLEKITVRGVTNRDRAWRIGMRARRAQRYQRQVYSFKTEMDALNSEYLSYVPLLDDVRGYGQSSILVGIEPHPGGAVMLLSEPMVWEGGSAHVISYRRPDGTLVGPFAASRGADDFEVIAAVPQPWPAITLSHEPPHAYFGTTSRWCFPALITNIKPNGLDEVSVTAKKYDERNYADDNNNAPT